jgi:hypothetical protein
MRKRSLTQRKRSTPTSTRNELLAKQKQQHNAPVKRSETEHKMHILPVEIWEDLTVSSPVAACQGRQICQCRHRNSIFINIIFIISLHLVWVNYTQTR